MARRTNTLPSVMVMVAIIATLSWDAPVAMAADCGGTQGTALLLGCGNNEAMDETEFFTSTTGTALHVSDSAAGSTGVAGDGGRIGVFGFGLTYGVYGQSSTYGVYGQSFSSTGVYGSGSTGVSGSGGSYGVRGFSPSGVGVVAKSRGTALTVLGKASFSRSDTVTVPQGEKSLMVTSSVTTSSMVLATAQQNAGVYVKAAVPTSGSFTIFLTGNAPTKGLKVAYFVLD